MREGQQEIVPLGFCAIELIQRPTPAPEVAESVEATLSAAHSLLPPSALLLARARLISHCRYFLRFTHTLLHCRKSDLWVVVPHHLSHTEHFYRCSVPAGVWDMHLPLDLEKVAFGARPCWRGRRTLCSVLVSQGPHRRCETSRLFLWLRVFFSVWKVGTCTAVGIRRNHHQYWWTWLTIYGHRRVG